MDELAIVEESVELLPGIGTLMFASEVMSPAHADLTPTQGRALAYLYHHGDVTVSELSRGLAISLPSASELVDRLTARNLTERSRDPADRRKVIVTLTEQALIYATHLHDLRREQVRAALGMLPRESWPCFVETLRALTESLRHQTT